MKAGAAAAAFMAAGAAMAGEVSACDVGALQSLRAAGVDQVTVQFRGRPAEMPLENPNQVAELVAFIKRLGASWTSGGGSGDGIIRFYASGAVAASVYVANDSLATDACRRRLSSDEAAELFGILTEDE
jgi:hypothetical protein